MRLCLHMARMYVCVCACIQRLVVYVIYGTRVRVLMYVCVCVRVWMYVT